MWLYNLILNMRGYSTIIKQMKQESDFEFGLRIRRFIFLQSQNKILNHFVIIKHDGTTIDNIYKKDKLIFEFTRPFKNGKMNFTYFKMLNKKLNYYYYYCLMSIIYRRLEFLCDYIRPGSSGATIPLIKIFISEAENHYNISFPKWDQFKTMKLTDEYTLNLINEFKRLYPNISLPKKDCDIKRELWKMQIRKIIKNIDPDLFYRKKFERIKSELTNEPRYYNDCIFQYSFNGDEFEWLER